MGIPFGYNLALRNNSAESGEFKTPFATKQASKKESITFLCCDAWSLITHGPCWNLWNVARRMEMSSWKFVFPLHFIRRAFMFFFFYYFLCGMEVGDIELKHDESAVLFLLCWPSRVRITYYKSNTSKWAWNDGMEMSDAQHKLITGRKNEAPLYLSSLRIVLIKQEQVECSVV